MATAVTVTRAKTKQKQNSHHDVVSRFSPPLAKNGFLKRNSWLF
jgi:hypothetical protein